MREVDVSADGPRVDLCVPCQLAWFDVGELDDLRDRRAPPELSAAARAAVGRLEADTLSAQPGTGSTWETVVDTLWTIVRFSV
jgi:hypothetical protein